MYFNLPLLNGLSSDVLFVNCDLCSNNIAYASMLDFLNAEIQFAQFFPNKHISHTMYRTQRLASLTKSLLFEPKWDRDRGGKGSVS